MSATGVPAAGPEGESVSAVAERINSARLATLGMLVAGVAHEINTPLGALNSNHDVIARSLTKLQEILEDEVVTQDELKEVRKIVRAMDGVLRTNGVAVERLVKLGESLRTFGRPDAAEVERIDLREGIDSTLTVLAHELQGVEVHRDYGEIPRVRCYPHRMNQVFMNLMMNATQAMKGRGQLRLRTYTRDAGAAVEIADTGPGLPDGLREKIFEPGFTTKGSRVGMGLGLAIVKQIITQHAGTIEVETAAGQGTRFTVWLPETPTEMDPEEWT